MIFLPDGTRSRILDHEEIDEMHRMLKREDVICLRIVIAFAVIIALHVVVALL